MVIVIDSSHSQLIYLVHTRPDIAYAVSMVSQFMHAPRELHLEAVYRILRYLKSSPGKRLFFNKSIYPSIEAYVDAYWAGSIIDRRSTTGILYLCLGKPGYVEK